MELNKIDLNKLNTLVAVIEQGGVSAAAARLELTRSAISQSVSSLESSLGVPLFRRAGRKLLPTPAALRLYRSARSYQVGLKKTVAEILGETSPGRVRVGLFTGFPKMRIAAAV